MLARCLVGIVALSLSSMADADGPEVKPVCARFCEFSVHNAAGEDWGKVRLQFSDNRLEHFSLELTPPGGRVTRSLPLHIVILADENLSGISAVRQERARLQSLREVWSAAGLKPALLVATTATRAPIAQAMPHN